MPRFRLTAYEANPYPGGFSVRMHLGTKPDPFPSREIEVRSATDAMAAREAYAAEIRAAVTNPVAVSIRLIEGRSPAGFKAGNTPYYLQANF